MAPLFFYVNYKSIFSWCCHTRFSSLRRHCSGYEEVVSQVAARIPKSWAAVMIFVPHRLHPSRHQAGPLAVHLKVVAVSHLRCFILFHFGAPGVLLSSFQHPGVTPYSLIGDEGPWSAVEGSDTRVPSQGLARLRYGEPSRNHQSLSGLHRSLPKHLGGMNVSPLQTTWDSIQCGQCTQFSHTNLLHQQLSSENAIQTSATSELDVARFAPPRIGLWAHTTLSAMAGLNGDGSEVDRVLQRSPLIEC